MLTSRHTMKASAETASSSSARGCGMDGIGQMMGMVVCVACIYRFVALLVESFSIFFLRCEVCWDCGEGICFLFGLPAFSPSCGVSPSLPPPPRSLSTPFEDSKCMPTRRRTMTTMISLLFKGWTKERFYRR